MDKVIKSVSSFVSKASHNNVVRLLAMLVFTVTIVQGYLDDTPQQLKSVIKNMFVKFVVYLVGMYYLTDNIVVSIVLAVLFITPSLVRYIYNSEGFELVWPQPDIYPGCVNIKVADLVKVFNNDEQKLKACMEQVGVPSNIELSDYNAPLIATYLYSVGYTFSDTCKVPSSLGYPEEQHIEAYPKVGTPDSTVVVSCPTPSPVSVKEPVRVAEYPRPASAPVANPTGPVMGSNNQTVPIGGTLVPINSQK